MKVLHILPNDQKFVLVAAEIFNECTELTNRFVVFTGSNKSAESNYAVSAGISVENRSFFEKASLRNVLRGYDCLVVHFLTSPGAKAILAAPAGLPIVWSGWGGDYYYLLPNDNTLIGEKTKKFIETNCRIESDSLYKLLREAITLIKEKYAILKIKKAIKRVDYFSTPFPEDFEMVTRHLKNLFDPMFIRIFYGSVTRTYAPGVDRVYGNNIQIGNSATPTNNHIEMFDILSREFLGDRKIIVPLSYGDAEYREAIIARGKTLFGDCFIPITDFMPIEKYNTLIAQCSTVIMGHRRQQGGGNVLTQLYKGAKVYLDHTNIIYQYLKSKGAFIYSLQELEENLHQRDQELDESQVQKNRSVLCDYADDELVKREVSSFFKQVSQHQTRHDITQPRKALSK